MLMKSFSFRAFAIVPTLFIATGDLQKDTTSLTKNVSSSATVQSVQFPKPHLISQSIPTTYYVSGSGSDSNSGLSTTSAFRTIQRAADLTKPGDTVLIMNGLYTNNNVGYVVYITRSGTSNGWIKYEAYPGHKPKIKHNAWHGIKITKGASYIQVRGLEVEGNNANITLGYAKSHQYNANNPLTSGNCISIDGRKTVPSHHIRILNNKVYNCGGGGIVSAQADYVTIDGNEVFNNAWYSPYGTSGIIMYQNWNYDTSNEYRMFVTNNKVYNNRQYIPWNVTGEIQDGNGIIIDDSRNTQNGSTLGAYQGRTLIGNNISYKNGGSGILSYLSDRVDIINNTLYLNSLSPEITKGQLGADESSNVLIFNNIVYSSPEKKVNTAWLSKNVTYKNNMYFNSDMIWPVVSSDIVANPQFVDPSKDDFRLKVTSPAINSGLNFLNTDFLLNPRPSGSAPDIGAYEYQF
jgi:parallel beta-helix repeat protein